MESHKDTNHPEVTEISDDRALRAMSSPTRLRILGLLRIEGAKTVGDISARTGDAPGSVSYHLSELEAAGLVEKAGVVDGDKRKSWWKARDAATRPISPTEPASPAQAEAADLFRRMAAVTYERTYERYLDALHTMDPAWADASMSEDQVLSLTPTELQEMTQELDSVVARWVRRQTESVRAESHQAKPRQAESQEEGDRREKVVVILQAFRWVP
ncbi:MAG: winged helix-turn-helix domain-containing protein [Bifidobacteriaceae bacterium]|jgi:DNA-binding transcriptional ArsR family regulator|nr:winged helix-turn-helix domain-containing protein [Bifidobacteriaceae bacterium]MCI1978852.1 winged helix-turn-helix domain-containing protein [Bifidobacteriaceae bacterium]